MKTIILLKDALTCLTFEYTISIVAIRQSNCFILFYLQ